MIAHQSFQYIRDLISANTGYRFDDGSEFLVESRLLPLARQFSSGSVNELIRSVQRGTIDGAEQLVVEALVDRDTAFFRDFWPFEVLRTQVLPDLKNRRAAQQKLVVWCIGCSTGQEPYSAALLLHEHFPDFLTWDVQVIGSDISEQAVHIAKEARYNQIEVNRGLPVGMLVKYFQREGLAWRLKPEVSTRVEFNSMNLLDEELWPEVRDADLVLLRNVIGKFAPDTQQELLRGILGRMQPDASLFLGAKENVPGMETNFETIKFDKAICFRPNAAAVAAKQASAAGTAAGQTSPPLENWSRLAKLAVRSDSLDLRQTRKVLLADEDLQKRLLAPSARGVRAARTDIRTLDEMLPQVTKEQLLVVALTKPLGVAVDETFTAMLPNGLESVSPDSIAADWPGQMVISFRFSGAATGVVHIRFIPDFAKEMAAPVLGLEPADVEPEMAQQMIAQAGSLVSGRFQALLAENGIKCDVEDGGVTQVNKFGLEIPAHSAHQLLAFRSEGQPIVVDIIVSLSGQRQKAA